MEHKTQNLFEDLIDGVEKKINKEIITTPDRNELGNKYYCLEQQFHIETDQELITLEVQDEFLVVTVDLTRKKVSGFGLEDHTYDPKLLEEMKELGEEILEKIQIFKVF